MLVGGSKEDEKQDSSCEVFDQVFGIRVNNPKVTPETANNFCSGMRKLRLCELSAKVAPSDEWITMGVIVDKSGCKRSANGNEYMIWRMSDLTFGSAPTKVLLFGDCVRQYWKLQVGSTLLLTNPQWAESSDHENEVLLKLFKSGQVVELGFCPDFGYCQASKKDGESCKNAVNITRSIFCPFHVQQQARHLSTNRGALNRSFNLPPKKLRFLDEIPRQQLAGVRTVNRGAQQADGIKYTKPINSIVHRRIASNEVKEKQWNELHKLVAEKPLSFGAKNLLLKEQREKENNMPDEEKTPCSGRKRSIQSMKEFIHSQPPKMPFSNHFAASDNTRQQISELAKEQMKIKRAAEILRNSQSSNKQSKSNSIGPQKESQTNSSLIGRKLTDEEILSLLKKKSSHEEEAKQEEMKRQNAYFNNREIEEQIEINATTLMELKGCKVVTCPKCSYTSQHQSTYCKTLGHEVRRHLADKRFFKCKRCQRRTFCYDRMPTKACVGCHSSDFYRVAMKDERKVLTETEQLKIKEEERNFSSTSI